MAPKRKTDWNHARELAERGCHMTQAARLLKIHHTTALYIGRRMGFIWPKADCSSIWMLPRRKPVKREEPKPTIILQPDLCSLEYERVNRLMALIEKIRA